VLQDAQSLVRAKSSIGGGSSSDVYTSALAMVRRASCNCYEFEAFGSDSIETKVSLLTQKLKLADPCALHTLCRGILRHEHQSVSFRGWTWRSEDVMRKQPDAKVVIGLNHSHKPGLARMTELLGAAAFKGTLMCPCTFPSKTIHMPLGQSLSLDARSGTFRIVVKNVTLLMENDDPLKTKTEEGLRQLLRLYSQLDDALLEASEWQSTDETRERVAPLLERTIGQQTALMASVQSSIEESMVVA
jgi:hypothetical protein